MRVCKCCFHTTQTRASCGTYQEHLVIPTSLSKLLTADRVVNAPVVLSELERLI